MSADAPRWTCPECAWASVAELLYATNVPPAGPLLECPRCQIGSPLDAWKKREAAK
jgi:hypothetical protein